MTRRHVTRLDVSVRDRLRRIALTENRDFNVVLNLFFQERLLVRLSASRHRQRFLLKGGLLLFALSRSKGLALGRPTKDIDLLANRLGNDLEDLRTIVAEISALPMEDGVTFCSDDIVAERIAADSEYPGVRIHVPVCLAGARSSVQVDIAFGDVVVPEPQEIVVPVLIEGMPSHALIAYSLETVVAEKLEIMISLSIINSRMKDFFDLFKLATTEVFVGAILQNAVSATFTRRGTRFNPNPAVFEPEFAVNEARQRQWMAFLRRGRLFDVPFGFEHVCLVLREFLQPIYRACETDVLFSGEWSPATLKWQ